MSDRYPFIGDKTVITHDGSVVWSGQVAVQSNLDFSNVSDATLTDSMSEGYVTAIEDNETQYLSVLETSNDITLEDLHNLTLGNPKIGAQEILEYNNETVYEDAEVNPVNGGDQQVVVFTVDGSDDLYGIQVTQDEEGNTQKYQFKFRTTDDGQLEAIPETIELLPNEEETQPEDCESNEVLVQEREETAEAVQETPVFFFEEEGQEAEVQETQVYIQQEEEEEDEAIEEYVEERHVEEKVAVFIKGERQSPVFEEEQQEDADDDNMDVKRLHYDEEIHQEEHYEEIEDVKAGILDDNLTLRATQTNIKHELLQEECETNVNYCVESQNYDPFEVQEEATTSEVEEQTISSLEEEVALQEEHYTTVALDEAQETVLQYQQYIPGDIEQVYEEPDATDGDNLQEEGYDHLFIQQHTIDKSMEIAAVQEEEQEQFVGDVCAENDSDNDDYQIVEGLHVTADGEIPNEDATVLPEPETVLQEVIEKPRLPERANILKQKSLLKPLVDIKPKTNKTLVYYVVPHVEKENVNSFSVNHTSYRPIKPNPRTVLKSSFVEPPKKEPEVVKAAIVDERLNKRFARSKEAMQAKLFNNFISKTTIPHAPVRQTRLPRKQQIKPVDNRRNEEIIVQEVMVSSKGFIENIEEKLKNKDKLEITGYVVLTDSDDDYDPKQDSTKKKKHKKHKDNQTVDSDSDVSVIEIRSDDEDPKEEENPKRGRGRPKKSPEMSEDSDSNKRRRGRPPKSIGDVEESPTKKSRTDSDEDSIKKEINCPHCTKTFPNQNSLSTHIQHHNLENSLRNKATRTIEYKHKCDDCQATFKNSILLKRHVCEKQAKPRTKTECVVCKKTFTTALELTVHKRSHVKENLVNTTSSTKVSPKKMLPRASTSQLKSPKRSIVRPRATFKCKECSRVCYTQESLALHEKTHRKFPCSGCGATFPSRLLLDAHVRVSCVKVASPNNKRLSFKVRKSFVQSPRRRSMKFSRRSALPVVNSTSQLNASTASSNGMLKVKVECDSCGEQFDTFQEKFKHQVKMHGMETPDKSILAEQKKQLHKPRNVHGGIPARDGLRKAFAPMRTKIAIFTPTKEVDQS